MSARARSSLGALLGAASAVAACFVGPLELEGKRCESHLDCGAGLVCGFPVPDSPRVCTRGAPNRVSVVEEQFETVYYCREVKPVLDATCVGACHGPVRSGSSQDFRLDYFEPPPEGCPANDGGRPDGTCPPGAAQMAGRVAARAYVLRNMPPLCPDAAGCPTDEQRRVLAAWAATGALRCDGGP